MLFAKETRQIQNLLSVAYVKLISEVFPAVASMHLSMQASQFFSSFALPHLLGHSATGLGHQMIRQWWKIYKMVVFRKRYLITPCVAVLDSPTHLISAPLNTLQKY